MPPPPPRINNLQSVTNISPSPIQTNNIVNDYNTSRESINRLVEEIDLSFINSSAVSPFTPSYQLPRTPNRI